MCWRNRKVFRNFTWNKIKCNEKNENLFRIDTKAQNKKERKNSQNESEEYVFKKYKCKALQMHLLWRLYENINDAVWSFRFSVSDVWNCQWMDFIISTEIVFKLFLVILRENPQSLKRFPFMSLIDRQGGISGIRNLFGQLTAAVRIR